MMRAPSPDDRHGALDLNISWFSALYFCFSPADECAPPPLSEVREEHWDAPLVSPVLIAKLLDHFGLLSPCEPDIDPDDSRE